MKKPTMTYEVWAPDAVWKDFAEKKLIKSKQGALAYMRWLRDRWGHLAKLAVVFASGCSAVCQMRHVWPSLIGLRPRWMAMGPPPTSWVRN